MNGADPARTRRARRIGRAVRRVRADQRLILTLVLAAVLALAMRTLVFQPFTIPSDSMRPALEPGDYIAVSKWPYGWSRASLPMSPPVGSGRVFGRTPQRGDIVVFAAAHAAGSAYVKRVIGLPGDMVTLTGGMVFINGEPMPRGLQGEETHLAPDGALGRFSRWQEILGDGRAWDVLQGAPGIYDDYGPVMVPEGHVFVLGDHRSESRDSRAAPPEGPGMVRIDSIIGRADRVLVSVRPDFSLWRPWTWARIRPSRTLAPLDAQPR